jgi:hypothetical protein
MLWIAAFTRLASATTFPPPPSLAEQLAHAEVAGVYVVRSTRTVRLDDGFVATRAEIEAVGVPDRGRVRRATLGLPGGRVGDRYVESIEGAPRVDTGDVLFLFLRAHDERYILVDGFKAGLYRRVETTLGPIMVDGAGQRVTAVSCDAVPARGSGVGLPWDDAVAAFAACGGDR